MTGLAGIVLPPEEEGAIEDKILFKTLFFWDTLMPSVLLLMNVS